MDYLKFIEDYKNNLSITLFEKVLVACARAKDLHDGKKPLVEFKEKHKNTAIAFYEVSHGLVVPEISEAKDEGTSVFDENEADFDEDEE